LVGVGASLGEGKKPGEPGSGKNQPTDPRQSFLSLKVREGKTQEATHSGLGKEEGAKNRNTAGLRPVVGIGGLLKNQVAEEVMMKEKRLSRKRRRQRAMVKRCGWKRSRFSVGGVTVWGGKGGGGSKA